MAPRPRKLGETQTEVLRCLHRHGRYPGGWVWDTPSNTVAILESLVRRGLVYKSQYGTSQAAYEPAGNRPYDGTVCSCGEGFAVWDYDPYVDEIYEDQDPSALLCGACFQSRKDDI